MDDINIVILSGVIVGTPEVREIGAKKTQVCNARIKSVRSFTYNGVTKESSTTKDIKAFGKSGETLSNLRGGDHVRITGRLATESWADKNDATKKHYKEVIECSEVISEKAVQPKQEYAPKREPAPQPKDDPEQVPF